jgi:hypothetical protein
LHGPPLTPRARRPRICISEGDYRARGQRRRGDSTQTLVHVCTAAHYEKDDQVCTQDDSTIGNLAGAHLIVYAAGQHFSIDSLIVQGHCILAGTTKKRRG